ncbi:MAG: DUF4199 domain-containing protein [Bacteroidota bacterium]
MKKFIVPTIFVSLPQLLATIFSYHFYNSKSISLIVSIINLIVTFFIFIYFVKKYKKDYLSNEMSFSKGFGYSIKISILWAIFGSLMNFVYTILNPEVIQAVMNRAFEEQKQKIIEQAGTISLSQEKNLKMILEINQNPLLILGESIIYLFFLGLFISLIVAAICKSKIKS